MAERTELAGAYRTEVQYGTLNDAHNVGAYSTERFLKGILQESFGQVRSNVVRIVERTVLNFSTVRPLVQLQFSTVRPPPLLGGWIVSDPAGRTVLKFSTVRSLEKSVQYGTPPPLVGVA